MFQIMKYKWLVYLCSKHAFLVKAKSDLLLGYQFLECKILVFILKGEHSKNDNRESTT